MTERTLQYSFHSQSRGLACDAVSNFEVVLADGSIVNANANENADLYRGLKGGSGNLGFVTKIDQRKSSLYDIDTRCRSPINVLTSSFFSRIRE